MGIPATRIRDRMLAKLAGYSVSEVPKPEGGTRWQIRRSNNDEEISVQYHPDEEAALSAALLMSKTNPSPPASASAALERWFFHSRVFRARDGDDMVVYRQALEDFPLGMAFTPGSDFRSMYPEDGPVVVRVTWTEGSETLSRTAHGPDEFARVLLGVLDRRLAASLYDGMSKTSIDTPGHAVEASQGQRVVKTSARLAMNIAMAKAQLAMSIAMANRSQGELRHHGRRAFRFLRDRADDYPEEKVIIETLTVPEGPSALTDEVAIHVKEKAERVKTWPEIAVLPSLGSHEDVVIVGNEQALRALRDVIDAALRDGAAEMSAMLMRDGEGYGIMVVKEESRMDEVPLHYAEEMSFPGEWPEWLLAAHVSLRR